MWNRTAIIRGTAMVLVAAFASSQARAQDKKPVQPQQAPGVVGQDKKPSKEAEFEGPGKKPETIEKAGSLYVSLKEVINLGAKLYNDGDHAGCYRVYQGAIMAVRPYLIGKPALMRQTQEALDSSEKMPEMVKRAFALRSALDAIRKEFSPEVGEKVPSPKNEQKTPDAQPR